jgi:hypothetical protein
MSVPYRSLLRSKAPWILGAAVGVLAVGVGIVALGRVPLPGVSPIDPANAMRISVIQPVEPEVSPGETMEVGELVDGYAHVAAAPVAEVDVYQADYASAWQEAAPPPEPLAWPAREEPTVSPTAAQPEAATASNPYGFDAPRPDYSAAREERRARLERMQAEGWREVPAGARLSADSAFY